MPGAVFSLIAGLLLLATTAGASTEASGKVLRVYGPGGPHHVLEECAELFENKHGIEVLVIKALPHDLERKLPEDGDIYYGGAEYMLEEFDRDNPGILDMSTVDRLYARRIGIVVRKGNPLDIKGVEDLRRKEVDILDVKLESMRHFHGATSGNMGNVRHLVYTGKQGVEVWMSKPELDAWVTYKSWHLSLEDTTDFIEIPGDQARRFTPVAVTKRSSYREEALKFLAFLKSEEARKIFLQHGWD